MKTKSRFSRNVYAISDRIWCNKHLRHTTTEKYVVFAWLRYLPNKMAENKVLEIEIPRFVNVFLIPSLHSRTIVVYGGVLAAIICVATACARRPRGALGDLTALLLRCRCEPTAITRRSIRSPWERRATARTLCMYKVRAVAWRSRRPHGVQWRCHGDATAIPWRSRRSHCAHLGVPAFWVFLARRAVAVRTPPWCDRSLNGTPLSKNDLCRHYFYPLKSFIVLLTSLIIFIDFCKLFSRYRKLKYHL